MPQSYTILAVYANIFLKILTPPPKNPNKLPKFSGLTFKLKQCFELFAGFSFEVVVKVHRTEVPVFG